MLAPLYGDQAQAIAKIHSDIHRKCRMAYSGDEPVGILVWKTQLSSEYARYKVQDSLEVKTFYLMDTARLSGRGFGTAMLDYILEKAAELSASQVGLA